jgi:hypothetical protein
VGVEGEPVHHGGGQPGVGEGRAPFAERGVGCDRDAGAFLAFGEDLEEQLGAAGVQLQVAELVEAGTMPTSSVVAAGRVDAWATWIRAGVEGVGIVPPLG